MRKLLVLSFIIVIFSCFIISANATEKSISKELDSFKKITEEKLFQEYSLYDVCQRLDKVIEKLQKIIDQNEKTIEALKQDNKESKVIERLNSIESQNKQILDLVKPMR
ncbi:MAG: hypothetical protein A2042_00535 [Candidatus Schekmanbacteria bacterium GWA2_38_11]|uniref:Uncharacterized protein n=1 Tax=Candidatus Schekmanbacteria bacterium GWA2_38_11 TaxID=1817876 RepID=A0A1F7RA41_9BACT|nr:MAG: hypothetical protein A2042_00535 [Candidatus Schekmanbacteria bacterium GWA2_38_11]